MANTVLYTEVKQKIPQNHRSQGIDITLLVDEAMDQNSNEQSSLLHKFCQGTAQIAISKHQEFGRGFVYGEGEGEEHQYFYMTSAQYPPHSKSQWRPPLETELKVNELLRQYHPQSEAILVICLPPTLQIFIIDQHQRMEMMYIKDLDEH